MDLDSSMGAADGLLNSAVRRSTVKARKDIYLYYTVYTMGISKFYTKLKYIERNRHRFTEKLKILLK